MYTHLLYDTIKGYHKTLRVCLSFKVIKVKSWSFSVNGYFCGFNKTLVIFFNKLLTVRAKRFVTVVLNGFTFFNVFKSSSDSVTGLAKKIQLTWCYFTLRPTVTGKNLIKQMILKTYTIVK